MNRWLKLMLSLSVAGVVAACGGGDDDDDRSSSNIVELAQARDLNALVAAVEKAGLAERLSAPGAITVFAPTDEAFTTLATQLGFADANAMVEALTAEQLASILTYHVLPTEESAAELQTDDMQTTLYEFDGVATELNVDADGSNIDVFDEAQTSANVVDADVLASNGTIHIIDKVLIPPGVLNVVQMAQVNPDLTALVGAVVATDLQGTLSGTGPFTVFAPVNAAFEAIAATVATLTTEQLTTVLTYHVLAGEVLAADIPFDTAIETVSGQTIEINPTDPPTITDTTTAPATITATDVRASNGVIHVIDKVLLPAL
jgi:uncharacterized surface protein with fasciclin (FAS1) repeats